MPIHDWTRVTAHTFHALHVAWLGELQGTLNDGVLPRGFYALAEQSAGNVGPDVLTLRVPPDAGGPPVLDDGSVGVAVATAPPQMAVHAIVARPQASGFPDRRIIIRHASDDAPVALLEIVSPSYKDRRLSVLRFVAKATAAIRDGLHFQFVDLFPPGRSDPQGLHAAIWADLGGTAFTLPAGRPLTLAAYAADEPVNCYVEPSMVGMRLVELPLFVTPDRYVNVPLERTYSTAYQRMPGRVKDVVESAA